MPSVRARRGIGLLGLAAAALLAGCVDQTHEVGLYREVLDGGRPRPAPLRAGETLTLERALALANADNEQLASQGEDYLQALIAKNRAFAAFLPTVAFQPNFTVEQAPRGNAPNPAPGAPPTSAATAAATQGGYVQRGDTLQRIEAPVVGAMNLSFRTAPLYQAAKLAVVQGRQLLLDAQGTVLLNVAQAYYQVLISSRQEAVLRDSLALQAARISYLRGRLKAQLALPLDLAQAEADLAGTRVQLNQAANDVRNGRRTLALLIGAAQVDGPLVESTLAPRPPEPVDDDLGQALAGRQDLLAAQAAVQQAHYEVRAAVAEYYPSASLNAAAYLYLQNYADAGKWNAILAANLPIFSGGAIRADVRAAWSHLRQAALFESYLRREIGQAVRTAYDNYVTSGAELDDLQAEVRAAAAAYRQAIQLERNGLALPLDVLTAQVTLLNAQLQLANTAYSRTVLYLDLVRADGALDPGTPAKLPWAPGPPLTDGPLGAPGY